MTTPTPETVAVEIANLKIMKPRIRQRNGFGDDNHAAVDAQLAVLEERLTEEDIYDRFGSEGEEEDSQHELDNALHAHRWLHGEMSSEAPSEGWKVML